MKTKACNHKWEPTDPRVGYDGEDPADKCTRCGMIRIWTGHILEMGHFLNYISYYNPKTGRYNNRTVTCSAAECKGKAILIKTDLEIINTVLDKIDSVMQDITDLREKLEILHLVCRFSPHGLAS